MKKNNLILAIETAIGQGSVSLLSNQKTESFRCGTSRVTRSSELLPDVREVLRQAGRNKSEIDLIVVSTGPGSLTGARIGMATAKGLALALNCRWRGVSVLDALAHEAAIRIACAQTRVCAVISAGRGKYYFQISKFTDGEKESTEIDSVAEQIELFDLFEKIRPELIILEKGAHSELKEFFSARDATKNLIIRCASDNLAEYIGKYFCAQKILWELDNL